MITMMMMIKILADRTSMIGYCHHTVVCLSVCLSVRLSQTKCRPIVAER